MAIELYSGERGMLDKVLFRRSRPERGSSSTTGSKKGSDGELAAILRESSPGRRRTPTQGVHFGTNGYH